MKAERRHELKTNTLAKNIEELPKHWRDYGSKLLLVVLVAAIVYLLVRYYYDKKARDAELVTTSMQTARLQIGQLERLPITLLQGKSAGDIATERQNLSQQADQALSTVIGAAKSTADLNSAYLARGDLNWALGNFPELPGAATQPALNVANRDGVLDQAKVWYQKVLEPGSESTPVNQFFARLGLAAIAENQGKWDDAKTQLQAITNASAMPKSFRDYATDQLARLPEMQNAPLLVMRAPVMELPPGHPPVTTGPSTASGLDAPLINKLNAPTTAPSTPATGLPAVETPTTSPSLLQPLSPTP